MAGKRNEREGSEAAAGRRGDGGQGPEESRERLARALRENLRKRKAQARARRRRGPREDGGGGG